MSITPWLKSLKMAAPATRRMRRDRRHSDQQHALAPRVEILQDRVLPAVLAMYNPGNQTLVIESDDDDTIIVNVNSGNVKINGNNPQTGPLPAGTLPALVIIADVGHNLIDLSAVTLLDFPALSSVVIDAKAGNDTIIGSEHADTIFGADGDDIISGNLGNDVIDGGHGHDSIDGEEGADSIFGNDGRDTISGGIGNDTIDGGHGNDVIAGNTGNDSIVGNHGDDSIDGGDGNDFINGSFGNDSIMGGAGNDDLFGGADHDSLFGNEGDDNIRGQGGDDSLDGGAGNDTLAGGSHNDLLLGGDGHDSLTGQLGDDQLEGGAGNDFLDGGLDDDLLRGQRDDDTLVGGAGDDTLFGGHGLDSLNGNAGDDLVLAHKEIVIYLDFDSATDPETEYVYSQAERDAIQLLLEEDYALFDHNLIFTQSQPTSGEFTTILFNDVMPGTEEVINFRDGIISDRDPDAAEFQHIFEYLEDGVTVSIIGEGHDFNFFNVVTPPEARIFEETTTDGVVFNFEMDEVDLLSVNVTAPGSRFISETGAFIDVDTPQTFVFPNTADWRGIQSFVWTFSEGANFSTAIDNLRFQRIVQPDVDFRNTSDSGVASVDVLRALGGGRDQYGVGQPVMTSENVVYASANMAANQLGRLFGLQEHDGMGPILPGIGISPGGPGAESVIPTFPGPENAIETSMHIMASPGLFRSDFGVSPYAITDDLFFSERSAIKLAFAEQGHFIDETNSEHGDMGSAQPITLEPLPVPNTLVMGQNSSQDFDVHAAAVINANLGAFNPSFGPGGQSDFYSFQGFAGQIINIETLSQSLAGVNDPVDTVVRVYDSSGNLVPYFDDDDSATDVAVNDDFNNQSQIPLLDDDSNIDIVFAIDISPSNAAVLPGKSIGDINGDGLSDTRLDAVLAGLMLLNEQIIADGYGLSADVAIITFDSSAMQVDMDPTQPGIQYATAPLIDNNMNGISDVADVLASIQLGGSETNFEPALQTAIDTFEQLNTLPGHGTLVFLSDHHLVGPFNFQDEAQDLIDMGIRLLPFGVSNSANVVQLRMVHPSAHILPTVDSIIGPGVDPLQEIEPNNSLATAQNLDVGRWNLEANRAIENATRHPHISVQGSGDGTADFYQFTVDTEGSTVTLDIDDANFDSAITLVNVTDPNTPFTVAFENNSPLGNGTTWFGARGGEPFDPQALRPIDVGSTSNLDPFLQIPPPTFMTTPDPFTLPPGVYVAVVQTPQFGDRYTLHVSVENHALGGGIAGLSLTDSTEPFVGQRELDVVGQERDSLIVNLVLPADDTYFIEVTTPHPTKDRGQAGIFVLPDDGTDDIVELDPVTGVELNRFPAPESTSPQINVPGKAALAYDGINHRLWFINGSRTDILYQIDPDTGTIIDQDQIFPPPTTTNQGAWGGLAVLPNVFTGVVEVYLLDVTADEVEHHGEDVFAPLGSLQPGEDVFEPFINQVVQGQALSAEEALNDDAMEILVFNPGDINDPDDDVNPARYINLEGNGNFRGFTEDRDRDGMLDPPDNSLSGANNPGEDTNGNGEIDASPVPVVQPAGGVPLPPLDGPPTYTNLTGGMAGIMSTGPFGTSVPRLLLLDNFGQLVHEVDPFSGSFFFPVDGALTDTFVPGLASQYAGVGAFTSAPTNYGEVLLGTRFGNGSAIDIYTRDGDFIRSVSLAPNEPPSYDVFAIGADDIFPARTDVGQYELFIYSFTTAPDVDLPGETLLGGTGNDTVTGGISDDTVNGQSGDDSLNGSSGDDRLFGGAGRDTLLGGAGDDSLDGQGNSDSIFGGSGDDTIIWDKNDGADFVVGEDGVDQFVLTTDSANDEILVTEGSPFDIPSISSVTTVGSQVAFFTDFENGAHTGTVSTVSVEGYEGLGNAGNEFEGMFLRNDSGPQGLQPPDEIRLKLSELPPHSSIDLNFLLAIIGNFTGMEFFSVTIDGMTIFSETFSNNPLLAGSFIAPMGVRLTPFPSDDRGFNNPLGPVLTDSAFDMGLLPVFDNIPHTASSLTIQFQAGGMGYQGGFFNSFALENLEVILNNTPTTLPVRDTRSITPAEIQVPVPGPVHDKHVPISVAVEEIIINSEAGRDRVTVEDLGNVDELKVVTVDLGNGYDVFDASAQVSPTVQMRVFGGNGSDSIIGSSADDTLDGGELHDTILGGPGNDQLIGRQGVDQLFGGTGSDTLFGNEGADRLFGEEGDDLLLGGNQDDRLFGGLGNDSLFGGDGADSIQGGVGNDSLYGENGPDTLEGEAGNDYLVGGAESDQISGGDGNDIAYGGFATIAMLDLSDDFINGNGGDDSLFGEAGNDTILGGSGNDLLDGGKNDDFLNGNGGDDSIRGGQNNDILRGAEGNDTLNGGTGNDNLRGDGGNDALSGYHGEDTLNGGAGQDTLHGGDGNDTLRGGAGLDLLIGADGNDDLDGQGGTPDTLVGLDGFDILEDNGGTDLVDNSFMFFADWIDAV